MRYINKKYKPKTCKDIIGQDHLFSEDGIITKVIKTSYVQNMIFFGPPGVGKTSTAFCICGDIAIPYFYFNSSTDSKLHLLEQIEKTIKHSGILIVEEIHRLNKDKQDILLPHLESENMIMISTTTENPFFSINPAIRSRCMLIEFSSIIPQDILKGLKKACEILNLNIKEEIMKKIALKSCGDFRAGLHMLDVLANYYDQQEVDAQLFAKLFPHSNNLSWDGGDEYYNTLSAFHKSMRGSNCNGALYWLARLLDTGDLKTITRRLIACVYEDVGVANLQLCSSVVIGCDAALKVGLSESRQILSCLVISICESKKSNKAYMAISKAQTDVKNGFVFDVPSHLKDKSYKSSSKLGVCGYKYPHDYPDCQVEQEYLPKQLLKREYYKK